MSKDESDSAQLGFDLDECGGESEAARGNVYTLDDMRRDLREMVAEAREIGPENLWSGQEHRYQKAVFRELCRNLPEDEGAQLSFAFFEQIDRIEQLMAA